MTIKRIKLSLEDDEYRMLLIIADSDLREPGRQARYILKQEFERRGLLKTKGNEKENDPKEVRSPCPELEPLADVLAQIMARVLSSEWGQPEATTKGGVHGNHRWKIVKPPRLGGDQGLGDETGEVPFRLPMIPEIEKTPNPREIQEFEMGFKVEQTRYEPLDPGVYEATVADIELLDGEHGEFFKIEFAFEDDRTTNGFCSMKFSPKSKLYKWTRALTQKPIPEDYTFDSDDILDLSCQLVIEQEEVDEVIVDRIANLLPGKKPAEAVLDAKPDPANY